MDNETLQIFLPAFILVFLGVISIWTHIRKKKRVRVALGGTGDLYNKIRFVDRVFKILLIVSLTITMAYSFFPEYYYLTGPIDKLDHPIINLMGVLVLKISLFWVVLAQFHIERTISRMNAGVDQMTYQELLSYSEKFILSGMLMMFIGLFLTISSVAAINICAIAAIAFDRLYKPVASDH